MTEKSDEGTVADPVRCTIVEGELGEIVKVERTTLFIKTISVTYGRKFNLDNYESATFNVTMWADRAEGGDLEADFATLWEAAREQVKTVAMPLLKSRNGKRQAIASNRPQVTPPPAASTRPAPSGPPAAPVPGRTVAGTVADSVRCSAPVPVSPAPVPYSWDGRTGVRCPGTGAPPQSNGVKTETFQVDSVMAQVTPKGNRNYAVRGGRVKKHGITMWPEVAQELEAIAGIDPENLVIGQLWNMASFNITATAEIPEGKKYPTKVIGLARGGEA